MVTVEKSFPHLTFRKIFTYESTTCHLMHNHYIKSYVVTNSNLLPAPKFKFTLINSICTGNSLQLTKLRQLHLRMWKWGRPDLNQGQSDLQHPDAIYHWAMHSINYTTYGQEREKKQPQTREQRQKWEMRNWNDEIQLFAQICASQSKIDL